MSNANLFAALRARFPADLDSVAVETDTGLCYSWRDVDRASAMLANLLESLDLPPRSRVAVQVEKSVEAMLLYLATLRAGYVFLPLNTAYQQAEIAYFIENAEPAVVVTTPRNFGWVSRIAFQAGTRHVFTLGDDRTGTLLERAAHCSDVHAVAETSPDDLAAILYTSGTTGRSKGAMLTHANLLSNAQVLKDYWGWRKGDVLIHALPIFHVHGLFVALHGALLNGSKMIWLGKFDAKQVVGLLPRATVFMGVPTMYVRLLDELVTELEEKRGMTVGHTKFITMIETPDARLAELSLLSDQERQHLLMNWNDTRRVHQADQCLSDLFETQAALTPERIALSDEGVDLTYREVDLRANQLAHRLMKDGVGLDVERHSCHGQDATVGPEQPGDQIEPGHRVVEQLPQGHDEEIADSVPGEGTVAVEPVLEDVTPGVPPLALVTQCCQGHAEVTGRENPELAAQAPAGSTVVGHCDDGRDVVGDEAECRERGCQPVAAPEGGHGMRSHSCPRSRWTTKVLLRPLPRRWANASAIATLRCLPPVQPTPTVA